MNGPLEVPLPYLDQVLGEIDDEARTLEARLEPATTARLEAMFQRIAPVAARRHDPLSTALAELDARVHISPDVPVASSRAGGTAIKRAARAGGRWYLGYVTRQVSELAESVSRSLHLLAQQLDGVRTEIDDLRPTTDVVVDFPDLHRADTWWVEVASRQIASGSGRVLHTACGDGWLVHHLREAGADVYGIDPRPTVFGSDDLRGLDVRCETLAGHLGGLPRSALGAVVLSGVAEAMAPPERQRALRLLAERVHRDGVVVIHSVRPHTWSAEGAPPAADLASGRPMRPGGWELLLGQAGFDAEIHLPPPGTPGTDYLVVARQSDRARSLPI